MSEVVKNLPAMQETQVRSLGREDPLEEGMATHSLYSYLGHSMDRGAWWAIVCGVVRVEHNWVAKSPPVFFFKLYNIVLVLSYINMNLPQVYTCSPSWTPLPPPSPYHPFGSSQCTSPKHPVSCIEPGLAGTLGRPRGMVRGGRREEGSGWGTCVYLWQIRVDIWQNQYNIVKLINKK